jgi:hypothetical protein
MANIQRGAGPTFTGANGAGVLVGDIDSGLSYKHGDFDDNAGNTRVYRIWDQTVALGSPPPPTGYTYGREYLPADVDANTPGGDTNGHGTHVMGILAGDGSLTGGSIPAYTYVGMAPMASIVEVKSDYTDTHIADGAAYFFGLATAAGMNAVLNISLGSNFGPHDGGEALSQALDALVGPGHAICVSAGNNAGTTSPLQHIHGSCMATYPTAGSMVLTLSGSGNNRIVGLDGYYDNLDAISVTVSHPTYGTFGPYPLGTINGAYPGVTFGTSGKLYVENGAAFSATGDPEVYVEIKATTASTFNGNWTFTFTPTAPSGPANGKVDMWQFYDSVTAIVSNFSSGIDDSDTVGGDIATSHNVITCAAWITKTNWTNCAGLGISYSATTPPTTVGLIASFSSTGPTRDGRPKPDIAAPGQAIGMATTQDVSLGTCTTSSTYYSYLNDAMKHNIGAGTSFSAPHVCGAVALLFQKFGALTRDQILQKLSACALVDANTGAVPNNTWGAGKLRVDVTDPNVTVQYPNGGDILTVGTSEDLLWSASDPIWSGVVSVDIDLSRDGGTTWENIATGIANTGVYNWNPTAPATTQAILRVKAHDVADNIGQDVSDQVWTIQAAVANEMPRFVAEATDAGVRISFSFADPSQYTAPYVERAEAGAAWTRLESAVVAAGDGYTVMDGTAQPGVSYSYRVKAQDHSGNTVTFGPIAGTSNAVTEFALQRAWPNPTRGGSTIHFSVPRNAHVAVKVFDVKGRLVSTLADNDYAPGRYQTTWNGRTRDGRPASNGVYFVHMIASNTRLVQRVTLVK